MKYVELLQLYIDLFEDFFDSAHEISDEQLINYKEAIDQHPEYAGRSDIMKIYYDTNLMRVK